MFGLRGQNVWGHTLKYDDQKYQTINGKLNFKLNKFKFIN